MSGVLLEDLNWMEAERALHRDALVVIPLGAAAKEHGPHLRLSNDWTMAEYFKQRVLQQADVIVAPTVAYHYYPAFVEYPGSVTLRLETARDIIVDICSSLAAFGPRRYYVLNTGVSTVAALVPDGEALAQRGITLRYTDITSVAPAFVPQQAGGSHADEVETSMMLYIAPDRVDMRHAARDYHPGPGRLTRRRNSGLTYSATGIYGDATLATWGKGRAAVEARIAAILRDLERLRAEPLPRSP
ncbi:MAG: creatininase family protein [Gammaproteobacteria bacterium]